MTRSLLMNLAVALLWLFLSKGGLVSFVIGFIIGFVLLTIFKPVLGSADYVRRVWAFFVFLYVFSREFVQSNIVVAQAALFRRAEDIHPNFITYDVSGMETWEIFLLSQCITLTPGTTTVDLIDNGETLIVHALDADNPDEVRQSIDQTLKCAILRFSR